MLLLVEGPIILGILQLVFKEFLFLLLTLLHILSDRHHFLKVMLFHFLFVLASHLQLLTFLYFKRINFLFLSQVYFVLFILDFLFKFLSFHLLCIWRSALTLLHFLKYALLELQIIFGLKPSNIISLLSCFFYFLTGLFFFHL